MVSVMSVYLFVLVLKQKKIIIVRNPPTELLRIVVGASVLRVLQLKGVFLYSQRDRIISLTVFGLDCLVLEMCVCVCVSVCVIFPSSLTLCLLYLLFSLCIFEFFLHWTWTFLLPQSSPLFLTLTFISQ